MTPEVNHKLAAEIARREIAGLIAASATEPRAETTEKLEAFAEQRSLEREFDLAARAAGAISPLHSPTTPFETTPTRPHVLTAAGQPAPAMTDAEVEALGQDFTPEAAEIETEVTAPDLEAFTFRESEFVMHSRNRSGEIITAETWEKQREARALLNRQTENLALACQSEGIHAFQPATAPRPSIVCAITGARIDPLPVRRINFFPAVAQARRAPMVNHLEAFLTRHPETLLTTFTYGVRLFITKAEELRAALAGFHRKFSLLNAGWLCRTFGFELVFRATELGEVKPIAATFDTPAGLSVHIHGHTFARFTRKLHPAQACCFKRLMWPVWGAHWDFGTSVNAAREACKYPVKPADLEKLGNADVAILFHAMRGMKMVQPMGELRLTIRDRFAAALKGRRWRVKKGQDKGTLELQFRPDWNAQPRNLRHAANRAAMNERRRRAALAWFVIAAGFTLEAGSAQNARRLQLQAIIAARQAANAGKMAAGAGQEADRHAKALELKAIAISAKASAHFFATFSTRPYDESSYFGAKRLKKTLSIAKGTPPPLNQIVARLPAAAYFDPVTRPALLVWNYNGDLAAIKSHPFVKEYVNAVSEKVANATAAMPSVHAAEKEAAKVAAERDAAKSISAFACITEFTPVTQLFEAKTGRSEQI